MISKSDQRPKNEAELQRLLDTIYGLAKKSNYDEAIVLCNWLIEDSTTRGAGYRERAAVKEHQKNFLGAIEDLRNVLAIQQGEPHDWHSLGTLLLAQGNTLEAIGCFSKVLELSEKTGNSYYANSARLCRAEAHFRRADYTEALADAELLPKGYGTYFNGYGMRSKESILADAIAASSRR